MDTDLKQIAPYDDDQVIEALKGLQSSNQFIKGVQFFYPEWDKETILSKLESCKTCSDFQVQFIEKIIKKSINETMSSFEIEGLDTFDNSNCLYISNHRDIFLDSALLQNHLYDIGKPFTEISLGDNLIVNETMKAVAKLNSMFTVFRSPHKSVMIKNSINLSKYLRYSITEKKVSSWIAQGNGRTKNGNDITAKGLIKMLLLSGGGNVKSDLEELNIVVSSISYEYEPCAFEKANELSIRVSEGSYTKGEYENISSIVKGIKDFKGHVKLVFEKLNLDNITFQNIKNKDTVSVSNEIDRIIHKNYKLMETNFIAYDLLYNTSKYSNFYSKKAIHFFKEYLLEAQNEDVYHKALKIYANPVINKNKLLQNFTPN